MMDRRAFITLVSGSVLAWPLAAEAQPARKVDRIGALAVTRVPHLEEALRQGLRDRGWIDGQNLSIEYRYWEGRTERLPELAADLVRLNVDVIVAWTAPDTNGAKQATKSIPIVFLVHGDPVGLGHVTSLAKPGGNVTGVSQMLPELSAKRLEMIKEVVPRVARVAVLWNAANPAKALDWRTTQVAGRALRLTLESRELRGQDDFPVAFSAIRRTRPDALLTLEDPLTFVHRAAIVEFASRERLPTIPAAREFAEIGGLMHYGIDLSDLARRGAAYVDKILKGAKPTDLPVEQPTKFELVINLKTARALGLTIPQAILLRADQIVE